MASLTLEPARRAPPAGRPRDPLATDHGWDALQMALAVFILASIGRIHQLYPQLAPLKPAMLSALFGIAYFLADSSRWRRLRTADFATTWFVVAILVWMVVTLPTSIHKRNSWEMLTGDFSKTVLMFVIMVAAVRTIRDVERLLLTYLVSIIIYSFVVATRFSVGSGAWRLVNLYSYDPNDFATWCVSGIPIAIYFLTSRRNPLRQGIALAGLPLMMMAFTKSGSRGGFVALGITLLYLMLFGRSISFKAKIIGLAGIALTLQLTASDQFWAQMRTILYPEEDYNMTSQTGRMEIWKRGVGYVLSRPITGVGAANFSVAEGTLSPLAWREQYGFGVKRTAPHNSYIQMAVDLGFPGIIFMLGAIVSAFLLLLRVHRAERAGPKVPHLSEPLMASFLGFLVGAFFLSFAYSGILYMLVGFATATAKVWHLSERERARQARSSAAPPRRAAAAPRPGPALPAGA